MHFIKALWGLAKAHPIAIVLFLVFAVVVLGGLVWALLGVLFNLIRKIPGGNKVAGAGEKIVGAAGAAGLAAGAALEKATGTA